jgi:hypothetical protein
MTVPSAVDRSTLCEFCQGAVCGFLAEVVVERLHAPSLSLCWGHLRQLLEEQDAGAVSFHRIGWQAACCRQGCFGHAATTITDLDDIPHLFCHRHVGQPDWADHPGVLLSDQPGRFHG